MSEESGLQLRYFVLKPSGDKPHHHASRVAMIAYAAAIEDRDPELANDLRDWVDREGGVHTRS